MNINSNEIVITIITSTYNRAYILPTLYKSLKLQTSHNFIWLIINDGSIDNTEQIVEKWMSEETYFKIKYFKQKNSGKHKAINNYMEMVDTEYSFIVDSDDFLNINAINLIEKWISTINDDFAGVSGLKGYYKKDSIIGEFPINKEINFIDCTNLERKKNKLTGDKAEIYKTEFLKKYPFPEFKGEKFITESTVWDKIAFEGFKLRWFGDVIVYCEYLDDGLTNLGNKRDVENFEGFTYFTKQNIDIRGCLLCVKNIAYYTSIAIEYKAMNYKDIANRLNINKLIVIFSKILWSLRCVVKNLKKQYR